MAARNTVTRDTLNRQGARGAKAAANASFGGVGTVFLVVRSLRRPRRVGLVEVLLRHRHAQSTNWEARVAVLLTNHELRLAEEAGIPSHQRRDRADEVWRTVTTELGWRSVVKTFIDVDYAVRTESEHALRVKFGGASAGAEYLLTRALQESGYSKVRGELFPASSPSGPAEPVPSAAPVPSSAPLPSSEPLPSAEPVPSSEPLPSSAPLPSKTRIRSSSSKTGSALVLFIVFEVVVLVMADYFGQSMVDSIAVAIFVVVAIVFLMTSDFFRDGWEGWRERRRDA